MAVPVFERLSALSEPIRARILWVLDREPLAVGELARVLQTSQPTVSRHLKQLGQGGWVEHRRVGTAAIYRPAQDDLAPEAGALWSLVRSELETDAGHPESMLAEDLRRLDAVIAQRDGARRDFFRLQGSRWDAVRDEQFGRAFIVPTLLHLLPPDLVAADLGCGSGLMLPLLSPVVGQLVGIDREAAMLDVARSRTADLDNVRLVEAELDAIPLEDASIDLALCTLVLPYIAEPATVLAEVARILRPDGRFVLVDMAPHNRDDFRRAMGHVRAGLSETDLAEVAEGAGLQLSSWRRLPPDPSAQGPSLFVAVLAPPRADLCP